MTSFIPKRDDKGLFAAIGKVMRPVTESFGNDLPDDKAPDQVPHDPVYHEPNEHDHEAVSHMHDHYVMKHALKMLENHSNTPAHVRNALQQAAGDALTRAKHAASKGAVADHETHDDMGANLAYDSVTDHHNDFQKNGF